MLAFGAFCILAVPARAEDRGSNVRIVLTAGPGYGVGRSRDAVTVENGGARRVTEFDTEYEGLLAFSGLDVGFPVDAMRLGAGVLYVPVFAPAQMQGDPGIQGAAAASFFTVRGHLEVYAPTAPRLFAGAALGLGVLSPSESHQPQSPDETVVECQCKEGLLTIGLWLGVETALDRHWAVGARLEGLVFPGLPDVGENVTWASAFLGQLSYTF